jgi:hypothetical protein
MLDNWGNGRRVAEFGILVKFGWMSGKHYSIVCCVLVLATLERVKINGRSQSRREIILLSALNDLNCPPCKGETAGCQKNFFRYDGAFCVSIIPLVFFSSAPHILQTWRHICLLGLIRTKTWLVAGLFKYFHSILSDVIDCSPLVSTFDSFLCITGCETSTFGARHFQIFAIYLSAEFELINV